MSSAADEYGVFGHPVNHSLSPLIHGLFARQTGQLMSYRPYDVAPQDFAARVGEFFAHGGRGLNVTLPHKIAAVEVAAELTARAAHAAAVNTSRSRARASSGTTPTGRAWCATCATTWVLRSPTAASWYRRWRGHARDPRAAARTGAGAGGHRQPHSRTRRGAQRCLLGPGCDPRSRLRVPRTCALRPRGQRHFREPLRGHAADPGRGDRHPDGVLRPRLRQVRDRVREWARAQGCAQALQGLGMLSSRPPSPSACGAGCGRRPVRCSRCCASASAPSEATGLRA